MILSVHDNIISIKGQPQNATKKERQKGTQNNGQISRQVIVSVREKVSYETHFKLFSTLLMWYRGLLYNRDVLQANSLYIFGCRVL